MKNIICVYLLLIANLGFAQIDQQTFLAPISPNTPSEIGTGGEWAKKIVYGDFNGDGKKDVALTYGDWFGYWAAFINTSSTITGSISFDLNTSVFNKGNVMDIAVSDLNADGKDDVVTVAAGESFNSANGRKMGIYFSKSTSSSILFSNRQDFTTPLPETTSFPQNGQDYTPWQYMGWCSTQNTTSMPGMGMSWSAVAIDDIDGDAKKDIIVLRRVANVIANAPEIISVYRNTTSNSGLTFTTDTTHTRISLPLSGSPTAMYLVDIDGDNKKDILVSNEYHSMAYFLNLSTAVGHIAWGNKNYVGNLSRNYGIAIGDLDIDGKIDIAISEREANKISIFKNTSTIGSVSFATTTSLNTLSSPMGIAIADIDNDNRLDLSIAYKATTLCSYISFYKNSTPNSISGISFNSIFNICAGIGRTSASIECVDLNNDGKKDIITLDYRSSNGIQRNRWSILTNYTNSNAPKIASFLPTIAGVGEFITISGVNPTFNNTARVFFNNNILSTSVSLLNSSTLIVQIPYGSISGPIQVITSSPGDSRFSLNSFVVTALSPVISSISPTTVYAGDLLTITGQNLDLSRSVLVNGLPAITVNNLNATKLLFKIPYGARNGKIIVNTFNGGDSNLSDIELNVLNNIIKVEPLNSSIGSVITITGKNYQDTLSVFFTQNDKYASSISRLKLISNIGGEFIATCTVDKNAKTGFIQLADKWSGKTEYFLNTITISAPLANLNGFEIETNASFYPNPTTDFVYAQGFPFGSKLQIFNIMGESIYDNILLDEKWCFDFKSKGNLPGIYFLKLIINSKVYHYKLILN